MTVNLLNLPSWEIESVDETRQTYRIRARYTKPPAYCPACGVADPGIHRFGKRENVFADLPHHGKRTEIVVERQRYRCKECGSAFLEPLPDMDPDHDATQRMVSWIEQQALRRPFAQVAKEVEVGESTVRRIFLAFTARMNAQYRAKAPKWLGIDEIHLLGRPRAVFTNLQRRYLIDMLEDRSQAVVTNYLLHLPRREQTEVVAIDMWRPYKTAVNAAMPQASVVIDKFHVLRTATSGLEGVRKSVRKGLNSRQRVQLKNDRFLLLRRASKLKPNEQMILDAWCGAFPDLYLAWELKETFYAIYDTPSKEEARDRMRAWPATVPKHLSGKAHFRDAITALQNWEPEILAYWDDPATNAYTESFNNQIRSVERQGRGYSFDVLRAKLLYTPPAWAEKEAAQREEARRGLPSWAQHLPAGWSVRKIGDLWVLVGKGHLPGFDLKLDAANARFALRA